MNGTTVFVGQSIKSPVPTNVLYVDMFTVKVLSLLMCRGTAKVKAKLLARTILGEERAHKSGDPPLPGEIARLKRAIKLLIYFSEIFPKKY